ncbi:MoaD/ThiS family protein [Azospirillum halopraeferens]|uniref:MoaD/ThiS family protein n=1 Tax=Azospirillum halopraeferens TaxID=34010 RepID=UPI0003FF5F37|nr:MoaD/ThiS family protein [Azospirillum halopraeferens]
MQIHYFALLRTATRRSRENRDPPPPTVGHLLRDLAAEYGPEFARWVLRDGALSNLAIILVDGRDVRGLQGLDTPLTADCEVSIFPPLAGG